MKVAIVHDYIKEFGGAERVLKALTEIYPDAPIYTAIADKESVAYKEFKNKKIITSWFNLIPFADRLASPLRFLTPLIWGSFNFKNYDLVISSASWYITKGFGSKAKPIEVCYCHTPPRWLYGYTTSVNFQKHAIVRAYALIVGHFLRMYDYNRAQKVNYFVANSKETAARIKKFYRRDPTIIYPPVSLTLARGKEQETRNKDYYFMVARLSGSKGLEMAVEAAKKLNLKLKIAGSSAGYYSDTQLKKNAPSNIEFLGQVTDEELAGLYANAKGFLALAKDEDFGITPVESMLAGTPVVAFNGGGYKETIIEGETGLFFYEYSLPGLVEAIHIFESMKFDSKLIKKRAEKFSKERFKKEFKQFVQSHVK